LWQRNYYFFPGELAILPFMREIMVSNTGPQTRRAVGTLNIIPVEA